MTSTISNVTLNGAAYRKIFIHISNNSSFSNAQFDISYKLASVLQVYKVYSPRYSVSLEIQTPDNFYPVLFFCLV